MSSVDDRIVNMQFNNRQFLSGATESQKALEGLDKTLANTGNSKGMTTLGVQTDQVATRFGALQVAAVTALATIVSKATTAGLNLVKSLTISPIMDGFAEYELNLKSVQTIMANTGEKVGVVNRYLAELNVYSDQTIYNFGQMADSIGKFTAAGVKLPAATDAIKGMANTAALTGANAVQLNSAMYQMSQALASGTIKLMDWNSLVNANMGTQNMQKALMATNRTLGDQGKLMDESIKKNGTFRDSLNTGWLTAETFTKTMKVMAGQTINTNKDLKALGMTQKEFEKSGRKMGDTVAFTVEQLQGMGYTKEAAKDLHRLSAASIESATKIKSITQLVDVVKESVGSGFSMVFQNLFGNLKEAGNLWTNVGNRITGAIDTIFDALNGMLAGWKKLGGYHATWNAFGNIFQTLGNLIRPFVAAFQTLLPSTGAAGEGLANASKGFESFTAGMEKLSRGAMVLTPILVSVAKTIEYAFGLIGSAFGLIKMGVGQLSGVADIGKNIVAGILGGLSGAGGELLSTIKGVAESIIDAFKSVLGIHSPARELVPVGIDIVRGLIEGISSALGMVLSAIMQLGGKIIGAFGEIGGFLSDAFQQLFGGMDSLDFASMLNAIFTGGLLIALMRFTKSTGGLLTAVQDFLGGIGESIQSFADALGTEAKANLIKAYAIAIGVLAVSLIALSFLDAEALGKSLGAMGIMLSMLVGSLYALGKVNSEINVGLIAVSLLLISAAMINLATAVAILGALSYEHLAKGLGSIAITLALLVGALLGLSKIKGSIEGMAGSILVISIAMNALAAAVLAFGLMDMKTLAKGLGAMAIGLGLMVAAMLGMDKMKGSVEGLAASIFIIASAITVMAVAVGLLGKMDMRTLAQGLAAMAIGLGIMVAALMVLSGNTAGVLAGAGAMLMMAGAMNMLVGVILILGAAPWETVAKGLGFVAAALGVFLLAGLGAMYVAPGLLALGVSLGLIGAALFLAGAGMLAFGTGFALLAAAGVAGVTILVAAFNAFIALLPSIAIQMAAAFVSFLEAIANATPRIRAAVSKIFAQMLGVVKDAIPKIVKLINKLMDGIFDIITNYIPNIGRVFSTIIKTILKVLRQAIPDIADAGADIIIGLLRGLERNMPKIAEQGVNTILAFLDAIANQSVRLARGAADALVDFLNGLADAIRDKSEDIRGAGKNIATAIVDGVTGGLLSDGMRRVKEAATRLADSLPGWMKKVLGINSPAKKMIPIGFFAGAGVASGLDLSVDMISRAAQNVGENIAASIKKGVLGEASEAVKAAVTLANAIVAGTDEEILKLQNKASTKRGEYFREEARSKLATKNANKLQKEADKADREASKTDRLADKMQALADRNEERAKRLAKEDAERAKELRRLAAKQERIADRMSESAKEQKKAAKEQQKAANKAAKAADKQQKAADKAAKAAEKAAANVQYAKDFKAADLTGKGDMMSQQAVDAAAQAQRLNALAQEQAAQANKLLNDKNKKNNAEGKRLQEEAKRNAEAALKYAEQAQRANNEANFYYRAAKLEEAKKVYARIADIEAERIAAEEAAKAEAELAAATTEGKAAIMAKRAEASDAKAIAAQQQAASAIENARRLAESDADAAMAQLDFAEKQASIAREAADRAKQEREQAAQFLEQAKQEAQQPDPGLGSNSGGSTLTPSRSILEDAAQVIDRYSASLMAAEELAASAERPVQFVQNNYSPKALSASEIYRQNKNLLSIAEIKMGV